MIVAEMDRALAHMPGPPAPPPAEPSRATPGVMQLTAVRERSGRIADFVWVSGNAAAAHLMHCRAQELPGKHLLDEVAGPLGHPVLVERYRRVIEHGNAQSFAQVHLVDGMQDIVIHRVVRHDDGVTVTLTNLSADRRAQERRLYREAWARQNPHRRAA